MSEAAADALVSQADEHFRTEHFDEAAATFQRAVSVFPHHARGWKGLGHSLLLLGKPHEAARAFDQAIGLAPGSATALWGGALAHAEIGNKIVAKDYLRRSIALQPSWVSLAATTPQLAHFLQIGARAADRLHGVFGPFSARRYLHASDPHRASTATLPSRALRGPGEPGLAIEVGRLPNIPDVGRFTFVTVGMSNVEWNEAERPRVELVMASTVDDDLFAKVLANLAFHLADHRFFPEPGTVVRDVVRVSGSNELAAQWPHVYVRSPQIWGVELPLDVGPPAITLAEVVLFSEDDYARWSAAQ